MKLWRIAPFDESCVRQLARELKISGLLAQILAARGCGTSSAAEAYLARKLTSLHDPEQLPGVSAAADKIVAAMKAGRRITIYGDYDVDGVTSTSLLWHCLTLAGGKVDYYIPSRLEEGYGLNCEAIRKLATEDPQRLIVSVDCGITSVAEALLAKELAVELIITDHHQFDSQLPDATLVHPRLAGNYPFGELCGVGVAFKLAWAVCARLGDGKKASPRMREFLLSAIGLAAIGTIADVVPLVNENRVIVHYGLGSLLDRANPGLKALLEVSKLNQHKQLSAEDVAFNLAPRINAAGRLGQARLAVELLTTDQPERAVALAKHLDELNKNRRTVEQRMYKQAKELVDANPAWQSAPALVLTHADWHAGVLGIVAGRVAEHFRKPAIMLAKDEVQHIAQGSGRSYGGYNLHQGVSTCRDLLNTFGGHHVAIGLKLDDRRVDELRDRLCLHAAENQQLAPGTEELAIDAEVSLSDLTHKAVVELDQLGPFGAMNRRPILVATGVSLAAPIKKMGEGERHLSLQLGQRGSTIRAVAFGKADWAENLEAHGSNFSVAFQPNINTYNGYSNVQVELCDFQPVI